MPDHGCDLPRSAPPGAISPSPPALSVSAARLHPAWRSASNLDAAHVVSDDNNGANRSAHDHDYGLGASDDEPKIVGMHCPSPLSGIRSPSPQIRFTVDASAKVAARSERDSPVLQLDSSDRSFSPFSPEHRPKQMRGIIDNFEMCYDGREIDEERGLWPSPVRDEEARNCRPCKDTQASAKSDCLSRSPEPLDSALRQSFEHKKTASPQTFEEPTALAAPADSASGVPHSASVTLFPSVCVQDKLEQHLAQPRIAAGPALRHFSPSQSCNSSDDTDLHTPPHIEMDSVVDLLTDSSQSSEESTSEAEEDVLPLPGLVDVPGSHSHQQAQDEDGTGCQQSRDEDQSDPELHESEDECDSSSDEPEEVPIAQVPFQPPSQLATEDDDLDMTSISCRGPNDREAEHKDECQDVLISKGKVLDADAQIQWASKSYLLLRFRDGHIHAMGESSDVVQQEAAKQAQVPVLAMGWVDPQLAKDTQLPLPAWSLMKESDEVGWVEEIRLPLPRITTTGGIVTTPLAQVVLGRSGIEIQVAIVARRVAPYDAQGFIPAKVPWRHDTFGQKWRTQQTLFDATFRSWHMLCLFEYNGRSAAVSSRVVSGMHMRLEATPSLVKVTDLDSTHGTVIAQGPDTSMSLLEVKGSSAWRPLPMRVLLGRHRKSRQGGIVHRRVEVSVEFLLDTAPPQSSPVAEIQSLRQSLANRRRRLLWRTWGQLRPAQVSGSVGLPAWSGTAPIPKVRLPLLTPSEGPSTLGLLSQQTHGVSLPSRMPAPPRLPSAAGLSPVAMAVNDSVTDNDSSAPEEELSRSSSPPHQEEGPRATNGATSNKTVEMRDVISAAPSADEALKDGASAEARSTETQPTLAEEEEAGSFQASSSANEQGDVTLVEPDVTLVEPDVPPPSHSIMSLKRKREPEPDADDSDAGDGGPPAKRVMRERVRDLLLGGLVGAVATFTSLAALGASLE